MILLIELAGDWLVDLH